MLANRPAAVVCSLVILTVTWAYLGRSTAAQERVNQRALAVKEFDDRVKEYAALQKKLEGSLPALTTTQDPADIEMHRKALAAAIRAARPKAKRGDVFGKAAKLIKEQIETDAKNRSDRNVDAATEEVPKRDPGAINGDYPANAPVATVPPLLLAALPPLPEGLEYRFMGRDLILRDTKANLVVDFIDEAAPTILKKKQKNAS